MTSLTRRTLLGSAAVLSGAAAAAVVAGEEAVNPKSVDPKTLGKTPHTKFAVNIEMWWNKRHEPGTGELHYNRVLKELQDLGYRGYVGLELVPQTTELAAAIAVSRADIW